MSIEMVAAADGVKLASALALKKAFMDVQFAVDSVHARVVL
jgi:hypothetical protein